MALSEATASHLCSRAYPPAIQFQFVYFNHMNLARKTNIGASGTEWAPYLDDLLEELHACAARSSTLCRVSTS